MIEPAFRVWSDDNEAADALIRDVATLLGEGLIDVELGRDQYLTAFRVALDRYRARSDAATEESFLFLTLQPDVNTYRLPDEVMDVRDVYRRGASGNTPGGTFFDPFAASFVNSIYALPYATGSGDLATYDFARQYQELIGRMFGRDMIWTWRRAQREIVFHRKFAAPETVLVHVFNYKPISVLLSDHYTRNWLRDYTLAKCKEILAEARGLYSSIPGPSGDIGLNADALREDARTTMERLEQEVLDYVDGPEDVYRPAIG